MMKYRVVMKISYTEVHFDFDDTDDAVKFMVASLLHLTEREDGKECRIYIKKVDADAEAKAEEEKEDE